MTSVPSKTRWSGADKSKHYSKLFASRNECECILLLFVIIKADERAADADKAVEDAEKTHKRAKDLDSEIQSNLKKIQGKGKLNSVSFVFHLMPCSLLFIAFVFGLSEGTVCLPVIFYWFFIIS